MKYRPIDLKPHEVRGILAGRQTQIRRVVNSQPKNGWAPENPPAFGRITSPHPKRGRFGFFVRRGIGGDFPQLDLIPSRYGQPGDRIWGREAFAHIYRDNSVPERRLAEDVAYKADGFFVDEYVYGTWNPSMLMPRWASRITLEVVAVRVERLQDISEADAWAEGCEPGKPDEYGRYFPAEVDRGGGCVDSWDCAQEWFAGIWESIHGLDSWDDNPWVEVCEFKRVEGGEGGEA